MIETLSNMPREGKIGGFLMQPYRSSTARPISATRVLITGGAGFIGSHVAECLIRNGAIVSILDNLNDFYPRVQKERNLAAVRKVGPYEFFCCDVRRESAVNAVFAQAHPQFVIHLAALAGVRPSLESPREYEDVNVAGTIALLEVCRRHRTEKFIFASSSSVYGQRSGLPFSEEDVSIEPLSPYAATKIAGEVWSGVYSRLYGIKSICLRIFSVFGPRQRPDLAIHKFVSRIDAGSPVSIYGDGSAARDYTYIDDVVAAFMGALGHEPRTVDNRIFDIFNIGSSNPIPLCTVIDRVECVLGKTAVRHYEPAHAADLPRTWANIAKAKQLLGYYPRVSFDEGLQRFAAWYRSQSGENPVSDPVIRTPRP